MAQGLRNIITNEGTFESAGALKIFFRSWRPEGDPRAVVVIVPGFNSHSAYYPWVAEQFVASGLAVYALDLRGRGKSDGEWLSKPEEDSMVKGALSSHTTESQ